MAQTELRSSGQTGTICQVTAPYCSSRHAGMPLFIARGTKFPVDPIDGKSTTWSVAKSSATLSTSPTAEI